MDDLWFVHALNHALLRVYSIAPTSPFLYDWTGWHAIGSKIPADSPVRLAQERTGQFVPPTIVYFYQHEFTQQYLFTLHTRQLLHRLFTYSAEQNAEVHKWADQLTAFTLPFDTSAVPRTIRMNGSVIVTSPTVEDVVSLPANGVSAVHYTLNVWETSAGPTPIAPYVPQPVYFAADYDREGRFHVNKWPSVVEPLRALLLLDRS